MSKSILSRALLAAALAAVAAPASAQQAQDPNVVKAFIKNEMLYVERLNQAGLPEYAELVIKDIEAKYPQARAALKVAKLEQILQLGKFDEAEKIIKAEPNQDAPETWAMRLTMADYMYARGKYDESLATYKKLFAKYGSNPPESIVEFVVNSAYKYAQMLLFLGKQQEAITAYETLLNIKGIPKDMMRQATFEYAQEMVKYAEMPAGKSSQASLLKKAQDAINKLLWTQDVWFGRSVALMAHIKVVEGNLDRAKKIVEDYMDQMLDIDRQLREIGEEDGDEEMYLNLSPLAECRYLLGKLYQEEGEKIVATIPPNATKAQREQAEDKASDLLLEAVEEFVNVYVQYPSFSWAPDAMARHEHINAVVDSIGYEVETAITPDQRQKIAQKQFQRAGMLYHQSQFKDCLETYEQVLKTFPEVVPDSINALSTMVRACVELSESTVNEEDKDYYLLYAETIAGHIAERFARAGKVGMTTGGDAVRGLSQFFADHNLHEVSKNTMAAFYRLYPDHPLAAPALMSDAEKLFKADPPDYAGAIEKYKTLVEFYSRKSLSFDAQRRLAECYNKLGDFDQELDVRSNYVHRVEARAKATGKTDNSVVVANYSYNRALRNKVITELRDAVNAREELRRNGGAVSGAAEADAASEAEAGEAKVDPVEAAEKRVKDANVALARVVNTYTKVLKILQDPETRRKYEADARERELDDGILQSSLFERAYCYSALSVPAAKVPEYKKKAIADYEAIIEKFPEADGLPLVYLQLGTLYSAIQTEDEAEREANAKKATEYFDVLAQKYPESDQAKNALYLQGKTLLELGIRTEGIAKFKEMLANKAGNYTPYQYVTAAECLYEARDYDTASQGYAAAKASLSAVKDEAARKTLDNKIEFGQALILFRKKKYTEAANAITAFIEANPKSYRLLEANEILSETCLEAAIAASDEKTRDKYFFQAIDAVKMIARYKTSPADEFDRVLSIGRIMETMVFVETKAKNEKAAAEYVRKAAAHYQKNLNNFDDSKIDASCLPAIEKIFPRYMSAMIQMGTYEDGSPVDQDVADAWKRYHAIFGKTGLTAKIRNEVDNLYRKIQSNLDPAAQEALPSEEVPGEAAAEESAPAEEAKPAAEEKPAEEAKPAAAEKPAEAKPAVKKPANPAKKVAKPAKAKPAAKAAAKKPAE